MWGRSSIASALLLAGCAGCAKSGGTGDQAKKDEPVRVAAASDLSVAFVEVGKAYEAKTGKKVSFSFGASGLLAKQIAEGAPFDLFAAANVSFVDDAVKSGECLADTKRTYAQGHLALWSKDPNRLPKSIEELKDPKYAKIAIANPEHAPYGKAAKQALLKANVWNDDRVVFGENVQQTLQYAQSGNADVSVVALSLAIASGGSYTPIDVALHDPLEQAMVLCKGGAAGGKPNEARQFEEFVSSPEGRAIMKKYGFLLPGD